MSKSTFFEPDYEFKNTQGVIILGVPKCCCTSIKTAFLGKDVENVHAKGALKYLSKRETFEAGRKVRITFVRNPYDRLLSLWKQKVKVPNKFALRASNNFETGMSFEAFVKEVCLEDLSVANVHYRPMHEILHWNGHYLPDWTGKVEDMANGWFYLQEKYGFPDLPWENKTPEDDPWTPELRGMVAAKYQKDFRFFDYKM